ncbi:MAG: SDR family NAD(P)-dependent oxidoreductase, partial [Myxococcales bacterium]|nr:SDR family NAD(P)-dependent oxidoreductase [Myxococcales bacterium]
LALPTEVPDLAGWVVLGDSTLPEGIARLGDLRALPAGVTRLIIDAGLNGDLDATAAIEATTAALATVQAISSDPRLDGIPVVWRTHRALAASAADEASDLAHAPLWGLLRAARAENPGRVLRSFDGAIDDIALAALAADEEPELATRDGQILVPRLAPMTSTEAAPALRGPALITGGLGDLGQALARHLVTAHGIRRLILTSRRGIEGPGAAALVAELATAAVEAVVVACDLTDRAQVARLLAAHAIGSVFHLAGALDDGIMPSLTAERVTQVMAPKAIGAWHLHTLTADLDLSAFVLFSSAAGTLGNPGQGSYAAANAFLDALAAHRRARGLPGLSLAFGPWQQQGVGMAAHLGDAGRRRMADGGLRTLSVGDGLRALDAALGAGEAHLVPIALDRARLAPDGPALLRSLAQPRPLPRASTAAVAPDPAALTRAGALDAIRAAAAVVLGLPDAAVPLDAPLTALGLDSLMGLEVRNRLAARLGRALPAGIVLQNPVPVALADAVLGASAEASATVVETLDPVRPHLAPLAPNQARLAFLDRVLDRRETYNIRVALRVDRTLDPARLQRAVDATIPRFDQLRMHLVDGADGPQQR